jgi:NADPH:quinone reductase-like Zn-dependent oxidoreductase
MNKSSMVRPSIKDGKLTHPIAAVYSLEELADAHLAIESGNHIGNVNIEIDSE